MRCFVLACAVHVLVATAVSAQVPDPSKTTIAPGHVEVEGWTPCASGRCPDPCGDGRCGRIVATVRDFANNVLAGATVRLDFTACSDLTLSCDPLTAETGQVLVAPGVLELVTDVNGRAVFRPQGYGTAPVPTTTTAPGANAGVPCVVATVRMPGSPTYEPVGNLTACVYDVNGGGTPGAAVNGADISFVRTEAGLVSLGAQARARDDYNQSGTVNGADVSVAATMSGHAALGTGTQNTTALCP